jgi:hypothetical protein
MIVRAPVIVAQSADLCQLVMWLMITLAAVGGLYFAVRWLRRWLKEDDAASSIGFTISDLRELHRSGQITDEEFEKTKAKMIQATQAAIARREAEAAERAKPKTGRGGLPPDLGR